VTKLKNSGTVLEERKGSWMIVEMANNKIEDTIKWQQQVSLKLKLREDDNAYTEQFTVYDQKQFDFILWKHLVWDINGT
jgi:hypothetical protein